MWHTMPCAQRRWRSMHSTQRRLPCCVCLPHQHQGRGIGGAHAAKVGGTPLRQADRGAKPAHPQAEAERRARFLSHEQPQAVSDGRALIHRHCMARLSFAASHMRASLYSGGGGGCPPVPLPSPGCQGTRPTQRPAPSWRDPTASPGSADPSALQTMDRGTGRQPLGKGGPFWGRAGGGTGAPVGCCAASPHSAPSSRALRMAAVSLRLIRMAMALQHVQVTRLLLEGRQVPQQPRQGLPCAACPAQQGIMAAPCSARSCEASLQPTVGSCRGSRSACCIPSASPRTQPAPPRARPATAQFPAARHGKHSCWPKHTRMPCAHARAPALPMEACELAARAQAVAGPPTVSRTSRSGSLRSPASPVRLAAASALPAAARPASWRACPSSSPSACSAQGGCHTGPSGANRALQVVWHAAGTPALPARPPAALM